MVFLNRAISYATLAFVFCIGVTASMLLIAPSAIAQTPIASPPPVPSGLSSGSGGSSLATPAPGTQLVTVPGGTPIGVQVVEKLSSGTAKVGDTFSITVAKDIMIDGWLVIAKGAGGEGEVLSVERAGSHGKAGNIGLQIGWVYAVSGEKIKLSSQRKTEEGENKSGASSTATIASYVLLGPLGLFAHNFVKGHDVLIDSTRVLQAYVDNTVHIVSVSHGNDTPGFAK